MGTYINWGYLATIDEMKAKYIEFLNEYPEKDSEEYAKHLAVLQAPYAKPASEEDAENNPLHDAIDFVSEFIREGSDCTVVNWHYDLMGNFAVMALPEDVDWALQDVVWIKNCEFDGINLISKKQIFKFLNYWFFRQDQLQGCFFHRSWRVLLKKYFEQYPLAIHFV